MLDKRLVSAWAVIGAGDPDIGSRERRHAVQLATVFTESGRWNHVPAAPVPMLDQRLCRVAGAGLIADCPDIVGAGARDALQDVVLRAGIRAGHELPLAAVPMLEQGALQAIG